jgi:Ca2+-binding RTX toxin-like protein
LIEKGKIMTIHQRRDPKTGQVIIEGEEGKDHIHVERRLVQGKEDGVIVDAEDDQGHITQQFVLNAQEVKQGGGLLIDAKGGDDSIRVDANVHSNLNLDGGEDNDVIYGGGGRDHIYGHGGHDILFGGGENDFIDGGLGPDELHGGPGKDKIIFDDDDLTINPGSDPGDSSTDGVP